jgi:hypothetical protein
MPKLAPDVIARVRQRYVDGDSAAAIMRDLGINQYALYFCLDGAKDPALPPLPRRRLMVGTLKTPRPRARAALVNRLWRAAERQVRDIEERLRLNKQQPDERERDARVLATMVKTLRELRALQDTEQEPSAKDEGPANLDDFRRELARKIDGLIAAEREAADRASES